ncbi:reverse transcriptase domain-containing protein [Pedobacter sp.]
MKRIGRLYSEICSRENILLADRIARRRKKRQASIIAFDKNFIANIDAIEKELIEKTYRTSEYRTRTIYEKKERVISILPYRDRVVQHAVMIKLENLFVSMFTADTYSCIKGRGIHSASNKLKVALRDTKNSKFCLKLDIKKFYPSVDQRILKNLLTRKFKDKDLINLLNGIIDSATGLPIGNYLSQYLANFYLAYFDHWLKEKVGIKHYFRYADDMVILHSSKEYLGSLFTDIKAYLKRELKLEVKPNRGVFRSDKGIDFLGYVHHPEHTALRKSIKQDFARKINKGITPLSKASYLGWTKHCNSKNLIKKLLPNTAINNS